MEERTPSMFKSALIPGLLIGIVLVLINLTFYLTDNIFSKVDDYLNYPVIITGVVLAQLAFRKKLGGTMSYGQALGLGILSVIIATLISGIYSFILYKFIDPTLPQQFRDYTEQLLVEKGDASEEEIEMALKILTIFQKPLVLLLAAVFNGAFTGTLVSLITSIFTKKNPPEEVPEI